MDREEIIRMAREAGIDELRQALETEQEPVLWLKTWFDGSVSALKTKSYAFADRELEPLYTAPPKKEWVGLTAYEIQEIHSKNQHWGNFACAIEAKLKEKSGGEYRNGATTERTKLNQENT